jgi:hypothetical protein
MSDTVDWLNMLASWATAGAVAGAGVVALRFIRRQNEIAADQSRLLRVQEELARRQTEALEKHNALLKEQKEAPPPAPVEDKTAKAIKLELFTRRYEIYTRMIQFCELAKKRDGKLNRQEALDFAVAINHAQFLFEPPAWEYISKMRNNGARLNQLYESIYEIHKDAAGVEYLAAKPVDPALNKEFTTLIEWFLDQPPAVKEQVLPYLDFTKLEG